MEKNIKKTPEPSKADKSVEVEKSDVFEVSLDDTIDKLLKTPELHQLLKNQFPKNS